MLPWCLVSCVRSRMPVALLLGSSRRGHTLGAPAILQGICTASLFSGHLLSVMKLLSQVLNLVQQTCVGAPALQCICTTALSSDQFLCVMKLRSQALDLLRHACARPSRRFALVVLARGVLLELCGRGLCRLLGEVLLPVGTHICRSPAGLVHVIWWKQRGCRSLSPYRWASEPLMSPCGIVRAGGQPGRPRASRGNVSGRRTLVAETSPCVKLLGLFEKIHALPQESCRRRWHWVRASRQRALRNSSLAQRRCLSQRSRRVQRHCISWTADYSALGGHRYYP